MTLDLSNEAAAHVSLVVRFVPANRFAQQLSRAGQVQLLLDARAKSLDSFHADVQRFGNLPGFVTLAKQLKHLEFTIAELRDGRAGCHRACLDKLRSKHGR